MAVGLRAGTATRPTVFSWRRARRAGPLERDDFEKRLDESGRRTGCERQAVQMMIDGYDNGGRRIDAEVANWRDCDARERAIEVPMLEPMRIARDHRCFIAVHVVGVITVTVRVMMLAVVMFVTVMVRIFGVIMAMDVRIVSSTMPMMNHAHDTKPARPSDSNLSVRPTVLLWQRFTASAATGTRFHH
jgi:hypothetical protein